MEAMCYYLVCYNFSRLLFDVDSSESIAIYMALTKFVKQVLHGRQHNHSMHGSAIGIRWHVSSVTVSFHYPHHPFPFATFSFTFDSYG